MGDLLAPKLQHLMRFALSTIQFTDCHHYHYRFIVARKRRHKLAEARMVHLEITIIAHFPHYSFMDWAQQ